MSITAADNLDLVRVDTDFFLVTTNKQKKTYIIPVTD